MLIEVIQEAQQLMDPTDREHFFLDNNFRFCAADFSLLNLPKGKSLGRSKPATNS